MKATCLIVDDEQYARKLLAGYVSKLPELELVAECKNSMEAMAALRTQTIDLMFLDIQMPDLSGVELLQSLSHKPVVIFTTAYREYALDGYSLDVIDYMLKPISFERFVQGVNKAMDHIRLKQSVNTIAVPAGSTQPEEDTIILKADYKHYRVKISDILYVEGLKEYVTFYTEQKKYVVHESLKGLEQKLPAGIFIRVHKSYIVNITKIESLYGNIIEIGKAEIPIGKSYAGLVKQKLFNIK